MSIFDQILSVRKDLTSWVIHWTKAQEGGPDARSTFEKILREGYLMPSFAHRMTGGALRPTIYGPSPAVCFTEQPLIGFSDYISVRGGPWISGFAIAVHRNDVHAEGGMPVITGLSSVQEEVRFASEPPLTSRNLTVSSGLGLDEQYRFVAFDPNRQDSPLDWSHEREWRWKPQVYNDPDGDALPGFPLAGSERFVSGNALSKGRIALIVPRDDDLVWAAERVAQIAAIGPSGSRTIARHWTEHAKNLSTVKLISLARVKRECESGNAAFSRIETHP